MPDVVLPSLEEIDALRKLPKKLVSPMRWRPKLSNHEPQWLEFRSAVESNYEVLEGVKVLFQWRPSVGVQSEKFNVGLFTEGHRVYAIDIDPDGKHRNKPGYALGRTYENQQISGIHEHLWTVDGYGYAEPLTEQTGWTPEQLWFYFCERIALIPGLFVAPDARGKIGQRSLL